ncbi:hypothetical protein [Actinomycetospora straminea]|uniref:Integral membrane protein n=1 Tax=Actinomycetospora straminea TaxID=663607 RepID=A0ABP9EGM9_9PSEU|nr:hypothetical protein [Actinomycetospora straminea]MDD7935678.1 hypothetical protein [Actinomycetospora straminea]
MGSVATGRDVRAMVAGHLEEEARRLTRRTRASMAVEGVLAVALGGAGLVALRGGDAATATVVGVRAGLPQFAVLAAIGLAILLTLRHPAWLRRVAVTKATVATAMFAAGAVYHPVGAWDVNLVAIFLPVVVALAGFVQFVLLGSANFVSEPSDVPRSGGGGRSA